MLSVIVYNSSNIKTTLKKNASLETTTKWNGRDFIYLVIDFTCGITSGSLQIAQLILSKLLLSISDSVFLTSRVISTFNMHFSLCNYVLQKCI